MSTDDDDDIYDGDEEEFDELEYDLSPKQKRSAHWRRIEALREKQWLKEQLDDYEDWGDELISPKRVKSKFHRPRFG